MSEKHTLADATPDPHNANAGTPRGSGMLADSLQAYGAGRSIVLDKHGVIIAGNKTWEAAGQIGIEDMVIVPTDGKTLVAVQRTDLDLATDKEAIGLALADNRVGEVSLAWDTDVLAQLQAETPDVLAGLWRADELAELLAGVAPAIVPGGGGDEFDSTPSAGETRVQPGDVWAIGPHRLVCGDSTDPATTAALMDGQTPAAIITDPPYGMRLDADFSGMVNHLDFAQEKGVRHGRKYENVTGDHADYDASPILVQFPTVAEQFWFGADYYAPTLGDTQHSGAWLVWDKRLDESADKMFGSCFELIWSRQKHKRDIIRQKWAGIFGTEHEPQRGRQHPNQKPVRLLEDLITRYTEATALIWDGYLGSGTTLIAAHRTGRVCYGVELEPRYCDVILRRAEAEGIGPIVRVEA